jgi:hypothetical protein
MHSCNFYTQPFASPLGLLQATLAYVLDSCLHEQETPDFGQKASTDRNITQKLAY